jgi:hypothetical protein
MAFLVFSILFIRFNAASALAAVTLLFIFISPIYCLPTYQLHHESNASLT